MLVAYVVQAFVTDNPTGIWKRVGVKMTEVATVSYTHLPLLRQCPHDYSIRAGQNLPDKEFRYLRTVIVTAAVHWGFSSQLSSLPLTFQHWAGVSPYTSTFVFAETCVFGKQFRGLFCCGPHIVRYEGLAYKKHNLLISLSQ